MGIWRFGISRTNIYIYIYNESKPAQIPSLGSTEDEGSFMHGKQSILLSSALKKSKTINATNAVTCRRKSSRTAKATKINK